MASDFDSNSSRFNSFDGLSKLEQDKLGAEPDPRIANLPHDQKQLLKPKGVWTAAEKLDWKKDPYRAVER